MNSAQQKSIQISAPAKVNLYLHITGRRDDGYHELDSLVAFADIGDTITLLPADRFSFAIDGPFTNGLDHDDNLVVKAARNFAELAGKPLDMAIILTKNLPVAGGIGGGSADAAATIKALAQWCDIDVASLKGLDDMALTLGADVPVCLNGKAVRMQGIGEKITDFTLPSPLPAVLINPLKPCSTTAVFAQREGAFSQAAQDYNSAQNIIDYLDTARNDLYVAAANIEPSITQIINTLEDQDGCHIARMSGSGATCFGLFRTKEDAEKAAAVIVEAHPEWWVKETILR